MNALFAERVAAAIRNQADPDRGRRVAARLNDRLSPDASRTLAILVIYRRLHGSEAQT